MKIATLYLLNTHKYDNKSPFLTTETSRLNARNAARNLGGLMVILAQTDLKRHSYTHLKTKPFVCGLCGRGFSRRDALKRHEKSIVEGRKVHCNPNSSKKADYDS